MELVFSFSPGFPVSKPMLALFFPHVLSPFENKEVFTRLSVYFIYICELLLIMNYIYTCKQLLYI